MLPSRGRQVEYELLPSGGGTHETLPVAECSIDPSSDLEIAERSSKRSTAPTSSPARSIRLQKRGWKIHKFNGWRVGVTWCAIATTTVLLFNGVWTVWATAVHHLEGGIGTIQEGDCEKAQMLSLWFHFAINALGTTLLAASNYCMQCLASPNRQEVDEAHSKHKWLDIGVPSIRNLYSISKIRCGLWLILAVSGVPLHILYNSAIFSTLSSTTYDVFGISQELPGLLDKDISLRIEQAISHHYESEGNVPSQGPWADLVGIADRPWQRLENADCIRAYGRDYTSSRGTLLVVTSAVGETEGMRYLASNGANTDFEIGGYAWMCSNYPDLEDFCQVNELLQYAANWTLKHFSSSDSDLTPVQYCLSQDLEEHCAVQFSIVIISIVIAANVIKASVMALTLYTQRRVPLVTLGDAVQSFLSTNDPSTSGKCLLGRRDYQVGYWRDLPQSWQTERSSWFQGASKTRWVICNTLCALTLTMAGLFLRLSLNVNSLQDKSLSHLWHMGLGTVTAESTGRVFDDNKMSAQKAVFLNVVVANSPQLVLSFLFLAYNSLFSCMLLTREWSGYAQARKPLRVTDPVGQQRSTYRLQLPYKYGLPLIALSGLLHWLVSQSLFLVKIQGYNSLGEKHAANSRTALGYSSLAIIFTIALGSIAVLVVIIMGFRRYDGCMPLAGSCSAAISAACHQPNTDVDAATLPLIWGVTEKSTMRSKDQTVANNTNQVGHCSFTSFPVTAPQEQFLYAGKSCQ